MIGYREYLVMLSEIPTNHLLDEKKFVNDGINYQPQLVQDFWTTNKYLYIIPFKNKTLEGRAIPTEAFFCLGGCKWK